MEDNCSKLGQPSHALYTLGTAATLTWNRCLGMVTKDMKIIGECTILYETEIVNNFMYFCILAPTDYT